MDTGAIFKDLATLYGPYVDDARRRGMLLVGFFAAAFILGFFLSPSIIRALLSHIALAHVEYVITSPFQVISMSVNIGLFFAIVTTFPLLLQQVYAFMVPALTARERRGFAWAVIVGAGLFSVGFTYGCAMLYYAFWTVAAFNADIGLQNYWEVGPFVSQVLVTAALLGVLFQFPYIVAMALRLGIVTKEFLRRQRRFVIALTLVIVALLPPTDGVSLLAMALPLIGLYELTLLVAPEGSRRRAESV